MWTNQETKKCSSLLNPISTRDWLISICPSLCAIDGQHNEIAYMNSISISADWQISKQCKQKYGYNEHNSISMLINCFVFYFVNLIGICVSVNRGFSKVVNNQRKKYSINQNEE